MLRRQFLRDGVAGLTAVAVGRWSAELRAAEPAGYAGLKMGVASYSLRKFTLPQAIAMTKELGLRYICLKDVHLSLKSSFDERRAALKQVQDAGLVMMGAGVITIKKDPAEARNVFQYAKDAGMPTIVCSPDPESLDTIEQLAKEFDIRVAIHNHGPGDKWWPSPLDGLRAVENRDERLGLCIDVGHTVRIGEDPVPSIHRCAKRLYDFHLKDVSVAAPEGKPVVLGTGAIDLPAVLRALLEVKFSGHLGLEYEIDAEHPLLGMQKSLEYVRSALAKLA